MTQKICSVCQKSFSKYTCPRCNLQYCSLDCYNKHSERCTEGFYREHVSEELRQTRATEQEKQHMLEILQRVHDADAADLAVPPDLADADAEATAQRDGGLSEQTIARLLEKVNDRQELQVALEDLTVEERAAFEAEVASGALARLVLPWEPWWRSAEAQRLSLSGAGTRLIQQAGAGSVGEDEQLQEPSAIPDPSESALPRLGALSRVAPSPLLQWQLVELLYAYCAAMHLYQGDWASDAMGAALAAAAASPALQGNADGPPPEPPASALLALTECISRACMPALHGPGGRQFSVAVVEDVKVLISCGRPAVVCAVTDVRRLFAAAIEQAKAPEQAGVWNEQQQQTQSRSVAKPAHLTSSKTVGQDNQIASPTESAGQQQRAGGSSGSTRHIAAMGGLSGHVKSKAPTRGGPARGCGRKRLRQQLQAAERRLVYFQSWANEQARDQYQHILEAVAEASQAFQQAQDLPDASVGSLADLGNVSAPQSSRMSAQQASGRPLLPRPLVQEYDSTTDGGAVTASLNGSSAPKHSQGGAQYDTLD